jgi:hypothetical protein
MPPKLIVPIVEGEGEVYAVPILLRRILALERRYDLDIGKPRTTRGVGKLEKELEYFLELTRTIPECCGVFIMRDTDEKCALELATNYASRARSLNLPFPVSIVCATQEYESWFVASLETLAGQTIKGRPGLPAGLQYPDTESIEGLRSPKGWLERQMTSGRKYRETEDQAALTAMIDFELVQRRSRSFRRLIHAMQQLLNAIDNGHTHVTP